MKRPMFFFSGECCGGGGGYMPPFIQCPPLGGMAGSVTDPRYYGLTSAQAARLLGVPSGTDAQAYLVPDPALTGTDDCLVVIDSDKQARATRAPILKLPVSNPAVSGSYPVPGSFPSIMVQGAGGNWVTIFAPTTGKYVLTSNSGVFSLTDAGTVPGLNEVGADATTAAQGSLLVITPSATAGQYLLQKLQVNANHVVVGTIDGSGNQGFKCIADTEYLTHPLAKLDGLLSKTYQAMDDGGTPVTGGLPQASVTGLGSIPDPMRIVYSPTNKRFYLAPASTYLFEPVPANSSATVPPVSYTSLPGGHGAAQAGVFSYSNVLVSFYGQFGTFDTTANSHYLALFRDGIQIQEYDVDNSRSFSLTYLDQSVPYGSHSYDIRWRRKTGADAVQVASSYFLIQTLF